MKHRLFSVILEWGRSDKIKKSIQWLRMIFTPIAFIFLVFYFWQSSLDVSQVISEISIKNFFFSVVFWAFLHLITPLLAVVYLNKIDAKVISYRESLFIYVNRLPARYIPGGIWHTVSRGMDFHAKGVEMKELGIYFFLENILSLSMALVLGAIFLSQGEHTKLPNEIILLSIVTGVLLIILMPVFINRFFIDKDCGNRVISFNKTLNSIVITGVFWVLSGVSFWFYITGFQIGIDGYSIFELAGTYIYSWAIGFIAIFSPQGLGITELVATRILDISINTNIYIFIILSFRLVIICADLLMWLIVKLLFKRS